MKQVTHGWLALRTLEHLEHLRKKKRLVKEKREKLGGFLEFINEYPASFIRGAWFPDSHVQDNIQDAHTWKYRMNTEKPKRSVKYRPPDHHLCKGLFTESRLQRHVWLDPAQSKLPDRCEAVGQQIRDAIKITRKLERGDVLAFNDSQVAMLFQMLSHYICDANVPVHCDARRFGKGAHIHEDLEKYWEDQVKTYYAFSKKRENFDLDENNRLQAKTGELGWDDSILKKCNDLLDDSEWVGRSDKKKDKEHWRFYLGKGNYNFWDYAVGICLVSFHTSQKLFPDPAPNGVDYKELRILEEDAFRERVVELSPQILADSVNDTAVAWVAAWERWELTS